MKFFLMLSLLLSLLENTSAQNTSKTSPTVIEQTIHLNDLPSTQYKIISKSETPAKDCYGIFFEYIYRLPADSLVTITGKFYNEPFTLTFNLNNESDSSLVIKDTTTSFVPKSITINPNTNDITLKLDVYYHILLQLYNNLSLTEQTSIEEYFKYILKRSINQEEYFFPINDDLLLLLNNYFKKLPIITVIFNKSQGNTYTLSIIPSFKDPDDFGHSDDSFYEE